MRCVKSHWLRLNRSERAICTDATDSISGRRIQLGIFERPLLDEIAKSVDIYVFEQLIVIPRKGFFVSYSPLGD